MRNRADVRRRLGTALLVFGSVACADALGPERDELAAARARWALTGADDYRFDLQRSCFCASDFVRPVRIEVLGGTVSSAAYADTGEPVPAPLTSVPTIDDLFDEIQDAVDRMASSIVAEYDPGVGYPRSVSIDYIANAIDDEMAFTVSSFQLLDTAGS